MSQRLEPLDNTCLDSEAVRSPSSKYICRVPGTRDTGINHDRVVVDDSYRARTVQPTCKPNDDIGTRTRHDCTPRVSKCTSRTLNVEVVPPYIFLA